ncbi:unnamed protein product [Acanthoscelides obtectus]|uniref:Uncharacterized protein n=1 Tax=Acanthoscelides obtectus TaxID=200917 RepID=A0A9P0KKL6_ACAOB|nr:unnamed protein product [Acanthoscelides obtectus]
MRSSELTQLLPW